MYGRLGVTNLEGPGKGPFEWKPEEPGKGRMEVREKGRAVQTELKQEQSRPREDLLGV